MKNLITLLSFTVVLLVSCSKNDNDSNENNQTPTEIILSETAKKVITESNAFNIALFSKTANSDAKNMMISPLSANIALNMVLNGANNQTYTQTQNMLGYQELTLDDINSLYLNYLKQLLDADQSVKFNMGNAIFHNNTFDLKEQFITSMTQSYLADVEGLDFSNETQSLDKINGWASDQTNGKIDQALDGISPNAVMFLLNAIYFKGTWTQKFDKDLTHNSSFALADKTTVEVPMMSGKIPVRVAYQKGFTAIEMSYGRDNFVMDLILPNSDLSDFITTFDIQTYNNLISNLDKQQDKIDYQVDLPKFSFKYKKTLNDILQSMGMADAFIDGIADFSNWSNTPTYISFVKQNAFIEVNEEGTEAAAVTTVGVETTSAGINVISFDRPFIFSIRERTTNTLLFIGCVYNPLDID